VTSHRRFKAGPEATGKGEPQRRVLPPPADVRSGRHERPDRPRDAGIVDEQVDRTEQPLDFGKHFVDGARIADVPDKGMSPSARPHNRPHRLVEFCGRARCDRDGAAGRRQSLGKGAPQAAATPRHDPDPTAQIDRTRHRFLQTRLCPRRQPAGSPIGTRAHIRR
jgi:hypothetical protein